MNRTLILGSSSSYRLEVLRRVGITPRVLSPDIDEKSIRDAVPSKLTLSIAAAKAAALLPHIHEPAYLITADQVVVCAGQIFEKPNTPEDVFAHFAAYVRAPAETVSALQVTDTETGMCTAGVESARLHYAPVPEDVVRRYIATGVPFQNAGSFEYGHPLLTPYVRMQVGTADSLMGMPLALLGKLLARIAWS